MFWVYILQCADGSYYTGHTDNLELRIGSHERGEIFGYTAQRRPVVFKYAQECASRIEALTAERQIKGWSRAKKEALIAQNFELLSELAKKKFDRE